MKAMSYRGYAAHVEFDPEDEIFVGRVLGVNDVVGFHADSVEGLKAALHEAVDDYLDACERSGKEPEKPFSGQVTLRIQPRLHASIAKAAELSGKSLNAWVEEALRSAVSSSTVRTPLAEG
jgi:predicted HicB family RNase H-like nuclease